jgi:hypothetical protein
MEPADLIMMHKEMQETLEYNFTHFYTEFKNIIIDELVDNFNDVLLKVSADRNHHLILPGLEEVKKRLKQ